MMLIVSYFFNEHFFYHQNHDNKSRIKSNQNELQFQQTLVYPPVTLSSQRGLVMTGKEPTGTDLTILLDSTYLNPFQDGKELNNLG